MTRRRLLLSSLPLGAFAGVLILVSAQAAFAGSDYCHLFTKDDIEKTLNTHVTEIKPWPLKVVLGPEGLHDQACVFFAGSRVLRITITETPSMAEARHTYTRSVSGHSIMNSAEPMPLSDIRDEAVIAASTVVMRRQYLVVNFSVADFVSDDETGLAVARALAAKVAEKISVGGSS
jgi:hypothetical protein